MFESRSAPAAEALRAIALDSYAGLAPDEIVAECEALGRLESQVKAHQLAAARALETSKAATSLGATSTGALLANTFGGDPTAAKRMLGQAARLQDVSQTQEALGRGDVTLDQAELIASTVKDLPGDPTPEQREACETQLLDDASKLSLKDLGRRADRITDTFASEDDVDAHENDTLVDRETRALKNSYFWMADRRDGTYKGEFVIPEAQGEMLKNALEALNAPQVKKTEDDPALAVLDDKPTYGQQMSVAFMTLIEHLPADRLPDTAGVGVTVTVNIELKSLIDGLKAGTLSTGCRISASEARRMAMGVPPHKARSGGGRAGTPAHGVQRQTTPTGLRTRKTTVQPGTTPRRRTTRRRMLLPGMRQTTLLVRRTPRPQTMGPRRRHQSRRHRPDLPTPPPDRSRRKLGHHIRTRRSPRIHPTSHDRPTTQTSAQQPLPGQCRLTTAEVVTFR